MKTFQTTSSFASNWPSGAYCILQYGGSCPYGTIVFSNHFAYFSFCHSVIFRIITNKCENKTKRSVCVCVCVPGFSQGSLYWDDEDINNSNEKGGVLPDGVYNTNTKIYYCCRSVCARHAVPQVSQRSTCCAAGQSALGMLCRRSVCARHAASCRYKLKQSIVVFIV